MNVSLSEVIRAARARRAALAGESAGYLVLAAADQIVGAPRALRAADVELAQDGSVRLSGGQASAAEPAERSLRGLLDELLLVASSGNPSLLRASRRDPGAGLESFVRELEAALIPANRAAARRALSRLQRETLRAKSEGRLAPEAPAPVAPAAPVSVSAPAFVPVPASLPLPGVEEESAPALALSPVAAPAATLEPVFDAELDVRQNAEAIVDEELELTAESPTVALAIPSQWPEPVVAVDAVEIPVELEEPHSDESPTRALPVAAIEATEEVCTRPEPVVLRASQRPPAPAPDEAFAPVACLPVVLTPSPAPVLPSYALTPALGTIVGELPVLPSEAFEELAADDHVQRVAGMACDASGDVSACLEPAPELSPLSPGVSILPSRQSDVRELVASFSVGGGDSGVELCRAVKEMAGLELTPAPFAALIR